MFIKADPVPNDTTGVLKGLEPLAVNALVVEGSDHPPDLAVLLRGVRYDETVIPGRQAPLASDALLPTDHRLRRSSVVMTSIVSVWLVVLTVLLLSVKISDGPYPGNQVANSENSHTGSSFRITNNHIPLPII